MQSKMAHGAPRARESVRPTSATLTSHARFQRWWAASISRAVRGRRYEARPRRQTPRRQTPRRQTTATPEPRRQNRDARTATPGPARQGRHARTSTPVPARQNRHARTATPVPARQNRHARTVTPEPARQNRQAASTALLRLPRFSGCCECWALSGCSGFRGLFWVPPASPGSPGCSRSPASLSGPSRPPA